MPDQDRTKPGEIKYRGRQVSSRNEEVNLSDKYSLLEDQSPSRIEALQKPSSESLLPLFHRKRKRISKVIY